MAENEIYLTVGKNPKGDGLLAIMSEGQPQMGDEKCTVLTLEVVKDMEEARTWFERMKVERPWEERN